MKPGEIWYHRLQNIPMLLLEQTTRSGDVWICRYVDRNGRLFEVDVYNTELLPRPLTNNTEGV